VSAADCLKALKPSGTYVNVTAPMRSLETLWAGWTSERKFVPGARPDTTGQDLTLLAGLIEQRKLRTVVDRIYPLEAIVEAHRFVDEGHKKGGVVVRVA
jgi:NADPH:quinone reductase-like Zn-dependent oxidoreductase